MDGELKKLITDREWSGTVIGSRASWPQSLTTLLQLMVTSRYSMWMGWGPELTFFYNDAYAAQTLGTKHPWALGRPAHEVWAEIWDAIGPRIQHVLDTGNATWDEGLLLFLERSGYPEETYHTFSYSPAPGENGETGGLFCVVIEETERVVSARRIATLGRLASLLSSVSSPEGVYAAVETCLAEEPKDIPFSLTYLFGEGKVPALMARSGLDDQELVARVGQWPFEELRASGTPLAVELDPNVSWPKGPWKRSPSHALVVPITQPGEREPMGAFIAGLNPHRPFDESIRSFVRLFAGQLAAGLSSAFGYAEAKKRAQALSELDRAKTAFFSNVSHEFRTPLTLMLAPIEDMRASAQREDGDRDRVELLHRNALRLLKLVNTLLDFARTEAGRAEALYEETDLARWTTDLASNFRSAIDKAGLTFTVSCPALGESIWVDRTMWEKIVLNLLSNALKFTFEGSISVRLRRTEAHAELEVADTGIGIAAHELPRLFERFHRIEGARSRSNEGSGIGLALVHDLVRMQGGQIDVRSEVGSGTTFTIRVPRGTAHLAAGAIAKGAAERGPSLAANAYVEEALRWIVPAQATDPGAAARGPEAPARPRLVVADDNADMLEYVSRLLQERWEVEPVRDGLAALEAVRRAPPALILTDVMMPGLDGFGLLKAIREDRATRSIPVLLLSARAGQEAAEEALAAGADDYIVKPFSARDLLVRITARLAAAKAAEDIATERGNLYRHFQQAPFPVAIFRGPAHVVELANKSTLLAWGNKSEREVIGQRLVAVLPELEGQPFPALLDQVFATGIAHQEREALARIAFGPEGRLESFYFNYAYAPLVDAAGRVEGVLMCAFDVTTSVLARREHDRAVAEAAVAREGALLDAEANNRARDEFLATMSHELRTPLNAMLGWAKLLMQDPDNRPKLLRGLEVIHRNAETQSRLIDDLLDVSRIISGKLSLTLKEVHLASLIQAAADVVRPAADARGLELVVDSDPDAGSLVGDPDRLQQIVWNLLSNAVRFTPPKGRVRVKAYRADSSVVIQVEDTGQGIAAEHLPRIFERFRQVDSSITRAHGGLGLGLAIVRHLVDAHGGNVTARSEGLGKGTTFTITLPLHAVVPTSSISERESKSSVVEQATLAAELGGVNILVVDDDLDSRELLRVVLEQAGATVTGVAGAEEALAIDGRFDLIISDIGMPQVDGYTFMRRLRAREDGGTVPAFALTAYARAEDAERAKRAGYQEHVAKPVDAGRLVALVRQWVKS